VFVLLAACSDGSKAPDSRPFTVEGDVVRFSDPSAEAATVQVESAGPGGDDRVAVTGRMVWDEDATVRVFPPVSGRVARIAADLGAWVKKGSVLATLASPDFGQAQAEAVRAAADLKAADRAIERVRLLFGRGASPRKDLDQAEADFERARAEAERTSRRLRLWGGDGAEPGRIDQDFPLRSPVAGQVVERNLNPGQELRSDTTTPLFVISDSRRLWVLLDITEKDLPDVAAGAPLAIRTPAYPERTFPGVLDLLGASLDPATRTVRARGKVRCPEGLLKAEMYVTVDLPRTSARRRLVLPVHAVIRQGDDRFVFLEEGPGRYRRTPIAAGPERDGSVPVLSGLAEGARVVTGGSLLLEAAWAEAKRQ
jgi:cobalt-zinc-cadmium efflux system membrane fusion protein